MKWWLGGFAVLLCQAQQELPPDLALLAKIKLKVSQNLKQLPNYTCTETIERWVRRSGESKAALIDTVHLEVAYVEGRELFGIAGAAKIDQSEIKKLVRGRFVIVAIPSMRMIPLTRKLSNSRLQIQRRDEITR